MFITDLVIQDLKNMWVFTNFTKFLHVYNFVKNVCFFTNLRTD